MSRIVMTVGDVILRADDMEIISDALMRAAAQDEYMGNAIKGDHPFMGHSPASDTVGKAYKARGDRTREYATLLALKAKEE